MNWRKISGGPPRWLRGWSSSPLRRDQLEQLPDEDFLTGNCGIQKEIIPFYALF